MVRTFGLVLIGALLLVACRSEEGASDAAAVSGFMVAVGGTDVRLCESLTDSSPPGCGGSSTEVVGLDPDDVTGTQSDGGTTWTESPITVVGDLEDGVLEVPPAPTGSAIFGTARTGDGSPVANVQISAIRTDGEGAELTSTDAVGYFVIQVDDGDWIVSGEESGGVTPESQTVEVDGSPVSLSLVYR